MATTFIGPDGYEYSATTPRQDPRSRGTQSINPLSDVMAILGAMQGNRTPRYASDAVQATAAANAGLFPLRQDPRKTARINERRREMNVTEQRGRTQGQRRRDATYRQQTIDANKENSVARKERAAARAEQKRVAANKAYAKNVAPPNEAFEEERIANANAAAYERGVMEERIRNEMIPDAATLRRMDATAAADEIINEYNRQREAIGNRPPSEEDYDPFDPYADPARDPYAVDITGTPEADMGYDFAAMDAARRARAAANFDQESGRGTSMHPDHVAMRQAGAAAAASQPLIGSNPLEAFDFRGMSPADRARARSDVLMRHSMSRLEGMPLPIGGARIMGRNPIQYLRPPAYDPRLMLRPQPTQPSLPYGPNTTPFLFGP